MVLIEQLARLLSFNGFGKYGDDADGNIFIGKLPYAPNVAIALFPLELATAKQMRSKVQVIVRGDGYYGTALTMAQEVADFFDGYVSTDEQMNAIKVEDNPIGIGMDKNNRYEFSFNLLVWGELLETELWFIFKTIKSSDMGVYVYELPPRHGAKERGEALMVPGRDGNLWLHENTLDDREIRIDCKVRLDANLDDIALWLRGSGKLALSGDSERAMKGRISRGVDFSKEENCYGMQLYFIVEPYFYENETSTMTVTEPTAIMNGGNVESLPIICIVGNGDIQLAVGGYTVSLVNVEGEITLDSTIGEAYSGGNLQNHKVTGELPLLVTGSNAITWTGDVSRIELTPNWRWI